MAKKKTNWLLYGGVVLGGLWVLSSGRNKQPQETPTEPLNTFVHRGVIAEAVGNTYRVEIPAGVGESTRAFLFTSNSKNTIQKYINDVLDKGIYPCIPMEEPPPGQACFPNNESNTKFALSWEELPEFP